MVVCPLCWNTRYGICELDPDPTDEVEPICPDVGDVAKGEDIHYMFLYTDKSIDF